MKPTAYAVAAGCFVLPSIAMALPPCVGADLATPMPSATGVEWRAVDIPTARFSGIWQQGQIEGFAYRIFPDMTAIVFNERDNAGWRIDVLCAQAAPCVEASVGSVPEAAKAAAKAIGECLIPTPQSPKVPVSAPVAPKQPALKTTVEPPKPAPTAAPVAKPTPPAATAIPALAPKPVKTTPPPSDLSDKAKRIGTEASPLQGSNSRAPAPLPPAGGSALQNKAAKPARLCVAPSKTDAGSAIRAIQRILRSIGTDPGPIDGVKGKRTTEALKATLGPDAAKLDPVSALIALTAKVCAGAPKTE